MKKNITKAHTKEGGRASRAAACSLGGKKHKGGKPCKVSHGSDARVIGQN